jgi:hypothetical protein
MKLLPGASELDELQPLDDDERLMLVRGPTRCRNDNDEEAATELASLAGPFNGMTLCLVPCGKLVKLKLVSSPSQLLKQIREHGAMQALEELKEGAEITGAPLGEVDRVMSIFDIAFEHVERMRGHDNPRFVRAAEMASVMVRFAGLSAIPNFGSRPEDRGFRSPPSFLRKASFFRYAFHLDGREDWATRYLSSLEYGQPTQGPEPEPEPEPATAAAAAAVDPGLASVCELGFPEEAASAALAACSGDVQQAVESLLVAAAEPAVQRSADGKAFRFDIADFDPAARLGSANGWGGEEALASGMVWAIQFDTDNGPGAVLNREKATGSATRTV